jgi:hypothetical protein
MVTIASCRVGAARALARGVGCSWSARAALRQLRRAPRRFSWQRARLFDRAALRTRALKQATRTSRRDVAIIIIIIVAIASCRVVAARACTWRGVQCAHRAASTSSRACLLAR